MWWLREPRTTDDTCLENLVNLQEVDNTPTLHQGMLPHQESGFLVAHLSYALQIAGPQWVAKLRSAHGALRE